MIKQSWTTICRLNKTAKIYANSNVEWSDNSGKKYSGKVKQIFNDRVSIKLPDGSIHIMNIDRVRKIIK
jgi:hypothetical protein